MAKVYELATIGECVEQIRDLLGDFSEDYDVAAIVHMVYSWDERKQAFCLHIMDDDEFWAIVAEHEYEDVSALIERDVLKCLDAEEFGGFECATMDECVEYVDVALGDYVGEYDLQGLARSVFRWDERRQKFVLLNMAADVFWREASYYEVTCNA